MRKTVYVAGPISKGNLAANVRQAVEAGLELARLGFAPLVPHAMYCVDSSLGTVLVDAIGCPTLEDWHQTGEAWAASADAVLRLPGESEGADREVAAAKLAGVPVFDSIQGIRDWAWVDSMVKGR